MQLLDLLAIGRAETPAKPALRFVDGQSTQVLDYAELFDRVEATAGRLRERGVMAGDRVGMFLGNRPELVEVFLAILSVGAIAVPMNLAYRRRELTHLLADSAAGWLVSEESQRAVLLESGISTPTVTVEELAQRTLLPAPPPAARVGAARDGDDVAFLLYTSGTTGASKGAMLSHQNLLATITGLLAAWAWRREDVLLLTLPLFHTHGLVVGLLTALAAGATVELRRRFDATTVVDELASGRASLFFGVPTMYVRLLEELAQRPRNGDATPFRAVRLFASGSAPLAAETFAAFETATGHRILERYGMTETGMSLSNLYAGPRLPGTVGVPLPGVSMRIVDLDGRPVESGGEGELLVAGGHVFQGYWRAPEKTAASFLTDPEGRRWFRTGDLARRDPETGYVTLLGRRHELVISGGFNIYPREIEEVLVTLPGIREAAIKGFPDGKWGEVPVAFVVADDPFDPAALAIACRSQLASFKAPARFHRVDALPRNAMGKVQKALLVEPEPR